MPETLPAFLLDNASRRGERLALAQHGAASPPLTWRELAAAVRACAAALLAAGHAPGERVAIFASNRALWPIADLAALAAGMTSVGIYPTSAPNQVAELLADAQATAVFVDTPARRAAVQQARARLPALRTVVCEADTGAPMDGVTAWAAWLAAGSAIELDIAGRVDALRAGDAAVVIYTSGSTGQPKGAVLSHRYVTASAESIRRTLGLRSGERMLSFLPFSHAAERVFGHAVRTVGCGSALLLDDHTQLWPAARAFQPTLFGGLPRFYEKICERIEAAHAALADRNGGTWHEALELGRRRSALRRRGEAVPRHLEARWHAATEPLRAIIEDCLGAAVHTATSGGAALPAHIAELLDAAGLTIYGAYGLTEHLCVASHRPGRFGFDGVGTAMHGTELRIADDGEILVRRCALTFDGYLGCDAETRAMFTGDGEWLRTGDLGRIDRAGVLHVTGRKKELIALSTGKKIAPTPLEARLTRSEWIGQAMLYGEGRKYLTGLLSPRRETVERWAIANGIELPYAELLRHPQLRAAIEAAVAELNATVSAPERVRRFALLERELSADHDEITPTLKLRRTVIAEHFAEQLEALYTEDAR